MLYIVLHIHEHLQWDCNSGLAGVVSGHTSLIIPSDVIFMFGSCTRGEKGYFPKCLLLICAGEKSRLWRECGVTCQSKPDDCPTAVSLGINSQFFEILLILEPGSLLNAGPFFILITFSSKRLELTHTVATVALSFHIDREKTSALLLGFFL